MQAKQNENYRNSNGDVHLQSHFFKYRNGSSALGIPLRIAPFGGLLIADFHLQLELLPNDVVLVVSIVAAGDLAKNGSNLAPLRLDHVQPRDWMHGFRLERVVGVEVRLLLKLRPGRNCGRGHGLLVPLWPIVLAIGRLGRTIRNCYLTTGQARGQYAPLCYSVHRDALDGCFAAQVTIANNATIDVRHL